MAQEILIPQGYRLIIESSEHGSSHTFNTFSGLIYREVEFYLAFCSLLYDQKKRTKKGLGDLSFDSNEIPLLLAKMGQVIEQFPKIAYPMLNINSHTNMSDIGTAKAVFRNLHNKLLGNANDFFCRTFVGARVEFFETDVEGHVVTNEFI